MTPLLKAFDVATPGRLQPTRIVATSGEMIAVIGPNGSGKTSLLRAIAGIEKDAGQVLVDGEVVDESPPARRMRLLSFLPATRSLIWPIAVRDLIALGPASPDLPRIDELVDIFELRGLVDRPVNCLSTGERSRVLLARALAARPRLMLLDEPLSNMDPYWVLRTLQILHAEAETRGCAILASVHDLSQVMSFDRVVLVNRAEIIADGAPAAVLDSAELPRAFRVEKTASNWRISEEN